MKRYVGKKASIATGVVTAFFAAAPGAPQASPSAAPDASAVSGGETVSPAALEAIRSKVEQVKLADTTKPIVKPPFHKAYFGQAPQPFVRVVNPPFKRAQ